MNEHNEHIPNTHVETGGIKMGCCKEFDNSTDNIKLNEFNNKARIKPILSASCRQKPGRMFTIRTPIVIISCIGLCIWVGLNKYFHREKTK